VPSARLEDGSVSERNLLPPLPPEQFEALRADIAKRGVLVDVEVDEDGQVLDGHHRLAIAEELGIEAPRKVRTGLSETEKVEHALKLNLLRRQMDDEAWSAAFERLAEARGVRLTQGARNDSTSATVAEVAAELGISERTARVRRQRAKRLGKLRADGRDDLADKVRAGETDLKRAEHIARMDAAAQARADAPPPVPPGADLYACGVSELVERAALERGGVDLIFTDPPYPTQFLNAWSELAEFAAMALKPGGMLVAYSGQFHLPEVLDRLRAHLEYIWMHALLTPGPRNQVHARQQRSGWKPLLVFGVPPLNVHPWLDDVFTSEGRVKSHHEWQQSIGCALHYIARLTDPGALVVDPFLGSGTTAMAALELGRRFIGCDVDANAVNIARDRLAGLDVKSEAA
jgi:site-specific DNA-methyltransferase (adenine-specific)